MRRSPGSEFESVSGSVKQRNLRIPRSNLSHNPVPVHANAANSDPAGAQSPTGEGCPPELPVIQASEGGQDRRIIRHNSRQFLHHVWHNMDTVCALDTGKTFAFEHECPSTSCVLRNQEIPPRYYTRLTSNVVTRVRDHTQRPSSCGQISSVDR